MALLSTITDLDDLGDSIADLEGALASTTDVSNTFYNDGDIIVVCKNGDASAKTLTVEGVVDPFGATQDLTITIAAGDIAITGKLNPARFNTAGICTLTLSAVTSVTIGLVRIRKVR